MARALVVLSGGQDSTTCAWWAKREYGDDLHAITFDYGQRHARELEAAQLIGKQVGFQSHEFVTVGNILKSTSPLVSDAELEQYADPQSLPGGLEKTFVPGRNMLFLTLAANRAYDLRADALVTGVCQEDFGGYPDCRAAFITAMQAAINWGFFIGDEDGEYRSMHIRTPLMYKTKFQTVEFAIQLGLPAWASLAWSHTSYDGAYPPTGHDHATLLRAKGFEEHGTPDPLVLRAWFEHRMALPATPNYDVAAKYEAKSLGQLHTMDFLMLIYNAIISGARK